MRDGIKKRVRNAWERVRRRSSTPGPEQTPPPPQTAPSAPHPARRPSGAALALAAGLKIPGTTSVWSGKFAPGTGTQQRATGAQPQGAGAGPPTISVKLPQTATLQSMVGLTPTQATTLAGHIQIDPTGTGPASGPTPPIVPRQQKYPSFQWKGELRRRWIDDPAVDGCTIDHTYLDYVELDRNYTLQYPIRRNLTEDFRDTVQHEGLVNEFDNPPADPNNSVYQTHIRRHQLMNFDITTGPGIIVVNGIWREPYSQAPWGYEILLALYERDYDIMTLRFIFMNVTSGETLDFVRDHVYTPINNLRWPDPDYVEFAHGTQDYDACLGSKLGKLAACTVLAGFVRGTHQISRILCWPSSVGSGNDTMPILRFDIVEQGPNPRRRPTRRVAQAGGQANIQIPWEVSMQYPMHFGKLQSDGLRYREWIEDPSAPGCIVQPTDLTFDAFITTRPLKGPARARLPETYRSQLHGMSAAQGHDLPTYKSPYRYFNISLPDIVWIGYIGPGVIFMRNLLRRSHAPHISAVSHAFYNRNFDHMTHKYQLRHLMFTDINEIWTWRFCREILYPDNGWAWDDDAPQGVRRKFNRGGRNFDALLGTSIGKIAAATVLSMYPRGVKPITAIYIWPTNGVGPGPVMGPSPRGLSLTMRFDIQQVGPGTPGFT
ncbi:hypothetical protein N7532_003477 [Penicillium argentinense]|uniref:Uncharacterized protein n=1 Tax=Penicillium argentinense TaxID=1131581 RepID=A0A9W9FMQ9_9EURO|nr:uncharacterized protein N7532_003477 [Penicillium argentinense]KAJ5102948.1 hypothetical protein N7532_003477 [Penicillium argentinense]